MRIQVYRDESGRFRWRRKADNGEVVAQGESHLRKWNAKRAALRLFPNDPVEDLTRVRH